MTHCSRLEVKYDTPSFILLSPESLKVSASTKMMHAPMFVINQVKKDTMIYTLRMIVRFSCALQKGISMVKIC